MIDRHVANDDVLTAVNNYGGAVLRSSDVSGSSSGTEQRDSGRVCDANCGGYQEVTRGEEDYPAPACNRGIDGVLNARLVVCGAVSCRAVVAYDVVNAKRADCDSLLNPSNVLLGVAYFGGWSGTCGEGSCSSCSAQKQEGGERGAPVERLGAALGIVLRVLTVLTTRNLRMVCTQLLFLAGGERVCGL